MKINHPRVVRPCRLAVGDTVGVVAPSSPFDKASFHRGIETIRQMGFQAKIDSRAYDRAGYLAGADASRAAQLNAMFGDDDVQAVICARGGYGALRILERLDYALIAVNPKPLIGFSDITALHQAFYMKCRMATFHGPTVTTLWKSDEATRRSWFHALTRTAAATIDVPEAAFLNHGQAEGVLVGGNLTVLSHLIGTPFWVPLKDKLLFIEDTGEASYRIDRMLFQMMLAGLFEGLAGLVLGSFERCGDVNRIHRMVQELFAGSDIPIASGVPIGHGDGNLTIPLGVSARLDSNAAALVFPESVFKE